MLPRVIMSNAVSADGRTGGFPADVGLYYELAFSGQVDAHLTGADTLLKWVPETPEEEVTEQHLPHQQHQEHEQPVPQGEGPVGSGEQRPLLVVTDSRGRLRLWHQLRKAGLWRGMVALCSSSTPKSYLEYLRGMEVDCIVAGSEHVDVRAALVELNTRYGVEQVHLDSGGTLNGALLRAGLVDEVNLIVHPCLVGCHPATSIFREPAPATPSAPPICLRLAHLEQVKEGIVWLQYDVVK